jgi:predicted RNA-binding Zn-ribbon protein involved in translation (DUF1610 family)
VTVASFARTLDQELVALARGVSFECPACGEFLLHSGRDVACPECELRLPGLLAGAGAELHLNVQAG